MNPEKIGRYEIKSELGRGGMATVYCAYDPRFERDVALKVLPREMLHDPQFRVRFEREAKTIAMLEHPAIVPVYDVGEEDGQPYFVMRYMTGGSLSDKLKKGQQTVQEATYILDRIASALDDAHSKGIIHRDLKPGNILFDNHGEPYISDFGIAKFTHAQTNVTGSAIIGTPAYISPEQAQGETIDGRSDIYALGVILFEMLGGRQPYEADTPMGVVIKHITDPVPHILDVNPGLPPDIELVIEKAMAKDRNERFSTAVELVAALHLVSQGESLNSATLANATRMQLPKVRSATQPLSRKQPTVPLPPVAAEPPKRSIFPMLTIGAVVICIVLAVTVAGGYFLTRPGGPLAPAPTTTPTEMVVVVPSTDTPVPPTEAPTATAEVVVEATATPEPAPTAVSSSLPILGGADKIAFFRSNDIWMMNIDGTAPEQLTTDGAAKSNLQWLPDGKTLLYMQGKLIKTVDIETKREDILVSYTSAEVLDGFQVSPDGSQVAISVNRELYVVPFDPALLAESTKQSQLQAMVKEKGCLYYSTVKTLDVQWSDDSTRLAVKILTPRDGLFADIIRVLDISKCSQVPPDRIDDFPGQRFDYARQIVSWSWDGDLLFMLNNEKRNAGFGDLTTYNMSTRKHQNLAPIDGFCCYRDATWSPDGQYVLFVFQDIRKGAVSPIVFYYVPYGSMASPGSLLPIVGDLPDEFFDDLRDAPHPVLRPAKP